jgi:hypothetical protein
MTMNDSRVPKAKRRWYKFWLWTLLVFVVVAGMGFVVIRHVVVKQHQQNTATELTKP